MTDRVLESSLRFVAWLDSYGETSYDHQSYFAGPVGGAAKALYYRHRLLGTMAVAPMIFSEALVPSMRRLFWKKLRFPIADAHYAMGFAFLSQVEGSELYYRRAVHFLQALKETRCPGYERYGWGYPFNWETRTGTMTEGTPMITTLPYVYEAFREVYAIDDDLHWRDIMRSIAEHARLDYRDTPVSATASTCAYTPAPEDRGGVVNASAYRAFLLTCAAEDFSDERYNRIAEKNLNFVLESQNPDGSWYYSMDGARDFVDHFHTCFVLKALARIEKLTGNPACTHAIETGVAYYLQNLFREDLLPKPFSRRPRMTVYRYELYDIAECINLAVLLKGRFPRLDKILASLVNWAEWQKRDGSFRSRRLMLGWDNVPMHRWAQSQMFRSLCFLLIQEKRGNVPEMACPGGRTDVRNLRAI
ncbi:MAG: prenyltransferase/squalene oxidase repeat-containing protein [Silvibacterium sp.]